MDGEQDHQNAKQCNGYRIDASFLSPLLVDRSNESSARPSTGALINPSTPALGSCVVNMSTFLVIIQSLVGSTIFWAVMMCGVLYDTMASCGH
jgi:hypothetical protein